jgi:DNA-binding NtrC family response regulator
MPARIVLVHDDPDFLIQMTVALHNAGFDVAAYIDPEAASAALETPSTVELLITRVQFSSVTTNGIALSLLARRKRPHMKVVFTVLRELADQTRGFGDFIPWPCPIEDVVDAARGRLARSGGSA